MCNVSPFYWSRCCMLCAVCFQWGLCNYAIVHAKLPPSPVILWVELGGKPNWLPLNFGYHDVVVIRSGPISVDLWSIFQPLQCCFSLLSIVAFHCDCCTAMCNNVAVVDATLKIWKLPVSHSFIYVTFFVCNIWFDVSSVLLRTCPPHQLRPFSHPRAFPRSYLHWIVSVQASLYNTVRKTYMVAFCPVLDRGFSLEQIFFIDWSLGTFRLIWFLILPLFITHV